MRIRRETLHADTVSLQSNPVAIVSPIIGWSKYLGEGSGWIRVMGISVIGRSR